jgi:putative transposase
LGKYVLEQVRRRYQFVVVGYVVMPEHIHLLVSEPQVKTSSTVMQALKIGFARRVLAQARRQNPAQAELFEGRPQHIWQKRFYDFNDDAGNRFGGRPPIQSNGA